MTTWSILSNRRAYNSRSSASNHKGCYLRRDEYMVRKADVIVAYWDLVPKGGTFYTVSKALECGKPVINIHERLR